LNLSTEQIAQPKDSKAAKHLQKSRKKTGGRLPADMRDLWGYLLEQDDKALMDILAQAVATAICTGRMDTLIEALGFDLRTWFVPTTENYFGRIGKQAILADIAEMGEPLTGRVCYAKLKTADLAKQAEIVLDREENAAWLPVPMRAEVHEPAAAEADEPAVAEADDDYADDYAEAA
jgi:ParB family chromosome partitioning protein